ncbi:MAG TPA: pyridoxamine 5'-phosphate oxidase family protein [Symbiobacteriaceae bacterium]|jgi:hypothetical protein
MINAAVRSVLATEGPATFMTVGEGGPHLVATWQSYLDLLDDTTIAFPAGGFFVTEANLKAGSTMQMVVGAKTGTLSGKPQGYRISGTAEVQTGTEIHQRVKAKFPWCRAAVVMRVTGVEKIHG